MAFCQAGAKPQWLGDDGKADGQGRGSAHVKSDSGTAVPHKYLEADCTPAMVHECMNTTICFRHAVGLERLRPVKGLM